MIDRSFLEKILELGPPEILEVDERNYSTKPIHPVYDPQPAVLEMNTLRGFADYFIFEHRPEDENIFIFVHVHTHHAVKMCSRIEGKFRQRSVYAFATAFNCEFRFGQWYELEDFIIAVFSQFQENDDQKRMLKCLGNLRDIDERVFTDDGISQMASVRKGISSIGSEPIAGHVKLIPFRTFREVPQPESMFVFRMRKHGEDRIQCALFEADGSAWKLDAMADVKNWLTENLPEGTVIIA